MKQKTGTKLECKKRYEKTSQSDNKSITILDTCRTNIQ